MFEFQTAARFALFKITLGHLGGHSQKYNYQSNLFSKLAQKYA